MHQGGNSSDLLFICLGPYLLEIQNEVHISKKIGRPRFALKCFRRKQVWMGEVKTETEESGGSLKLCDYEYSFYSVFEIFYTEMFLKSPLEFLCIGPDNWKEEVWAW